VTQERDLERWESGAISTDDLLGFHPEEDLRPLLAMHERMQAAGASPVELDELALRRFVRGLPGRGATRRRGRGLLLAVAAVVLSASIAIAVPVVRHGVTSISHLFGPGSPSPTGQPEHRPGATSGGDATRGPHGASGPASRPDRQTGEGHHGAGTSPEAPGNPSGEDQQGGQEGGAEQGDAQQGDAQQGDAQQEGGDQQDPGSGGDQGGDVSEGSSTDANDPSGNGQVGDGSGASRRVRSERSVRPAVHLGLRGR
jgi:hypothetical protein